MTSVEHTLKVIYDKATKKYSDDYRYVLWALADHPDLHRRSSDIFISYSNIMSQLDIPGMDRHKFNTRLNALKKKAHGGILTGTRQGWYQFSEPVIRGYCRLQAQKHNVILDRDNYMTLRKLNDPQNLSTHVIYFSRPLIT